MTGNDGATGNATDRFAGPGSVPGGVPGRGARDPGPMRTARRSRSVIAFVIVIAVLAGAAVVAGSYLLLRTNGSPAETAARYLSAWQRGNVAEMRELSVNVPAGGLAKPIAQVNHDLGARGRELRLGRVTGGRDRKSTRLNSSHPSISYAV